MILQRRRWDANKWNISNSLILNFQTQFFLSLNISRIRIKNELIICRFKANRINLEWLKSVGKMKNRQQSWVKIFYGFNSCVQLILRLSTPKLNFVNVLVSFWELGWSLMKFLHLQVRNLPQNFSRENNMKIFFHISPMIYCWK